MGSFFTELLAKAHADRVEIAIGFAVFLVSFLGSAVGAAVVLCRLPVDHLRRDDAVPFEDRPRWQRLLLKIAKNTAGLFVILLGVVLSLPGVPGQGVLTILLGVMLLDLPGKQRFERRLMGRRSVLTGVNTVRARCGRAPLLAPLHPR